MEPCKQEAKIGGIEATLESIAKTLERLLTVFEKVAAQGEALETLKKESQILFDRVHDLEIAPGKQLTKEKAGVHQNIILVVVTAIVTFFMSLLGAKWIK